MKSEKHGDHLHQLTRMGWVNCYLVEEDDGFTLIDTMIPGSAKGISSAAGDQKIQRIVLTHAHGDHIGSLDALHKEVPAAAVIIGRREARLLKKDKTMEPDEPQDKLRGGYPGAKAEPALLVDDGDMIGSLRVVSTPGHTPGHFSLVDTRDGTLFSGDVFTTIGGVETSARRNLRFPFATMATWHRPTEIESAKKLGELDPNRLAPGHGKVVESPGEAMDRAISRAEG